MLSFPRLLLVASAFCLFSAAALHADDKQFVLEGFKKDITDGDVVEQARAQSGVGAVRIDRSRISDAAFVTFAQWPKLYGVYLRDTAVTGLGFARLEKHQALRQVTLVGPNVNNEGVRAVGRLTHVTHLHIGNGPRPDGKRYNPLIRGEALAAIGSMEKLTHLTIDNADISDADLKHLADLKSVESIDFWRCPQLTRDGLLQLQKRFPKTVIRGFEPELKLGK